MEALSLNQQDLDYEHSVWPCLRGNALLAGGAAAAVTLTWHSRTLWNAEHGAAAIRGAQWSAIEAQAANKCCTGKGRRARTMPPPRAL